MPEKGILKKTYGTVAQLDGGDDSQSDNQEILSQSDNLLSSDVSTAWSVECVGRPSHTDSQPEMILRFDIVLVDTLSIASKQLDLVAKSTSNRGATLSISETYRFYIHCRRVCRYRIESFAAGFAVTPVCWARGAGHGARGME